MSKAIAKTNNGKVPLPRVEARKPVTLSRKPKTKTKLSRTQSKFLDAYLASYNATQAAAAIGVAPQDCSARGHLILSHELVQQALARRLADAGINPARVKTELAQIAFAGPQSDWAQVVGFANLKLKCLEYMARLCGMEDRSSSGSSGSPATRQQPLVNLLVDNPDRITVSSVVGLSSHEVGYSPDPTDSGES